MTIDLSSLPTLLFMRPVFAEVGRAMRTDLSQDELQKCEDAARDLKGLVDRIGSARRSGDETLALLMTILNGDTINQLSNHLRNNCTTAVEKAPQPAPQTAGTSAFWATPPFRVRGAVHQVDHSLA